MDSPNDSNGLNRFRKVGVIGGGASGLVAARELKRHGFQVIVYERNDDIGGVWLYDPRIEDDDLLGLNPNRKVVSSSLYASLRVNLPREIMGFMDYPFVVKDGGDRRRFPGHQEMQLYLSEGTSIYWNALKSLPKNNNYKGIVVLLGLFRIPWRWANKSLTLAGIDVKRISSQMWGETLSLGASTVTGEGAGYVLFSSRSSFTFHIFKRLRPVLFQAHGFPSPPPRRYYFSKMRS